MYSKYCNKSFFYDNLNALVLRKDEIQIKNSKKLKLYYKFESTKYKQAT